MRSKRDGIKRKVSGENISKVVQASAADSAAREAAAKQAFEAAKTAVPPLDQLADPSEPAVSEPSRAGTKTPAALMVYEIYCRFLESDIQPEIAASLVRSWVELEKAISARKP